MPDGFDTYLGVGPYGVDTTAMSDAIAGAASNIRTGTNPSFAWSDFIKIMPQFDLTEIPSDVQTLYVDMANAAILEVRYRTKWKYCMCLFIAHFCTFYLQRATAKTAAQVVNSAQMNFPKISKEVGDVSINYDTSSISGGLPGWAAWKGTGYGMELATLAKIAGAGGMYVR